MTNKVPLYKFIVTLALLGLVFGFANFTELDKIALGTKIGLERIPRRLGEWEMVQGKIDRELLKDWEFLNEVLMRTYRRSDGATVWLAISYGSDQRQSFSIHLPEGCYRAAGFDMETVGMHDVFDRGVSLKRLIARGQGVTEPISYWVMLDGEVVTSHFARKFKQLYYTIFEKPAYGALVRVSSLSADDNIRATFELQDAFIKQFAAGLPADLREILFGNMNRPEEV